MAKKSTTNLVKKLVAVQATTGLAQPDLARLIGIANRTLQSLLNGTFAKEPTPSSDTRICNRNKLRGYVESLQRVCVYLEYPMADALREYRIDAEWPLVRQLLADFEVGDRTTKKRAGVLSRIRSTEVTQLGVLTWPPLAEADEQLVGGSWSARYLKSLFYCMNPRLQLNFRLVDHVHAGIQALLQSPPEYDAVFGIYQTGNRRFQGLEFLKLPGLGIPVAALVCGERDLPVLDLLSRRVEVGAQDAIRFVAMPEEVGETFIRGILGPRSEANLITCPDGSVSAVAAQIIEVAIMQQASVIFLADAITVSNVSKHLTKHYFEPEAMKGRSPNDIDFICRLVRGARVVHSPELPVNELAIALPRDERDWRSLLREVQREELFGAEAALTARLYAEIIAMIPQLEPLPLTPELSPSKAKRFAQLFAKAASLQLKQELLDKSGPSDRSSRSSRLSAFIEKWTGDATPNPTAVWGGFQSNIFKPALEYIESAILGSHSDYVQGLTITPAVASKTLQFLNVSETICQYAILPALASCGLLEAQTKDASECLSPLSKFPNSYLVPNVPADSKRGRWMFWQRYHSEVVFACLIASMPTDKKREAIEFIRNHTVSIRALQGLDTFDGVASRVKQDREFHLSICYCGSPEDRPDAALRTLERAFNRLNAALSQSAVSRFAKINTQHEEILNAIESSGEMPVQENYSKIFAAYESHFFDLRYSYLSLDSDFQSRLSNSVLREVSSLEKIEAHRFFEGLRCQVYRSQSNAPLEWSAIEQDAVLCNNIVDAIIAGATFHYVSDKEAVLPKRDFEAFLSKINSTLSRRGHNIDLPKRIFRVVIPKPSFNAQFFKNTYEKECNALLVYGDRDCVSNWQLTVRRGVGSVAPQEIRRRIDATDAQKRDYLRDYCHSLSALSEDNHKHAIESITQYL